MPPLAASDAASLPSCPIACIDREEPQPEGTRCSLPPFFRTAQQTPRSHSASAPTHARTHAPPENRLRERRKLIVRCDHNRLRGSAARSHSHYQRLHSVLCACVATHKTHNARLCFVCSQGAPMPSQASSLRAPQPTHPSPLDGATRSVAPQLGWRALHAAASWAHARSLPTLSFLLARNARLGRTRSSRPASRSTRRGASSRSSAMHAGALWQRTSVPSSSRTPSPLSFFCLSKSARSSLCSSRTSRYLLSSRRAAAPICRFNLRSLLCFVPFFFSSAGATLASSASSLARSQAARLHFTPPGALNQGASVATAAPTCTTLSSTSPTALPCSCTSTNRAR